VQEGKPITKRLMDKSQIKYMSEDDLKRMECVDDLYQFIVG